MHENSGSPAGDSAGPPHPRRTDSQSCPGPARPRVRGHRPPGGEHWRTCCFPRRWRTWPGGPLAYLAVCQTVDIREFCALYPKPRAGDFLKFGPRGSARPASPWVGAGPALRALCVPRWRLGLAMFGLFFFGVKRRKNFDPNFRPTKRWVHQTALAAPAPGGGGLWGGWRGDPRFPRAP